MSKDVVSVASLAEVNPRTERPKVSDVEVSFVPMADVSEAGRWTRRQTRKLTDVQTGYTAFKDGDVLFAKITPCMENGKGALVKGLVGGIGYGSTEFHVLRAIPGKSDPEFLSQVAMLPELREKAASFFTGSAGQRRVSARFFEHYFVPNYTPDEQRRIADLLSAVDEQIEAVTLQAKKQEEVCRAAETDLLRRIVQTAEKRQIGSFAKVGGGKRLPAGHEYSQLPTALRYLRVTDFFKQTVDYHSLQSLHTETFHALRRYELQPGDLYISIAGSIGWAGVMPKLDAHRVILTENAARIRLEDEAINPEYLALFINSLLGQQQIEERIGTGGGVPKLALERIRTIQVALPSETEQEGAANFIGALRDGVKALRDEQTKLLLLKQGLARQLLNPEPPAPEAGSSAQ